MIIKYNDGFINISKNNPFSYMISVEDNIFEMQVHLLSGETIFLVFKNKRAIQSQIKLLKNNGFNILHSNIDSQEEGFHYHDDFILEFNKSKNNEYISCRYLNQSTIELNLSIQEIKKQLSSENNITLDLEESLIFIPKNCPFKYDGTKTDTTFTLTINFYSFNPNLSTKSIEYYFQNKNLWKKTYLQLQNNGLNIINIKSKSKIPSKVVYGRGDFGLKIKTIPASTTTLLEGFHLHNDIDLNIYEEEDEDLQEELITCFYYHDCSVSYLNIKPKVLLSQIKIQNAMIHF